jgi:hypothetical protein
VFLEVFIVEKIDEAGDEGSGDTTTIDVQTHLGAYVPRSACFFDEAFFSGEKQNFLVLGLPS